MVKSRFPGKPSKHFNRRKVSGVNSVDSDGLKAAEDCYIRLSYFNYLFSTNDEDKSFHGFSPHEDEPSKSSLKKKVAPEYPRKKKKVQFSPRKLNSSNLTTNIAANKKEPSSIESLTFDAQSTSSALVEDSESGQISDNDNAGAKENITSIPTLSGKFVLPSRSNHSSRVIKPNKRFLQSDLSPTPPKKACLSHSHKPNDTLSAFQTESSHLPDEISLESGEWSTRHRSAKAAEATGSSAVKFVLRKPRLKIKSQSLPKFGGPFSSPSGNSLSLQGQTPSASVKKVFCGVCGSLRTFKFLQQARKFGIFSCIPCRKFILKIIRSERNNVLSPLCCSSGAGNCPIRQNSLAAQCFSNDTADDTTRNENDRCEACWLSLCLKSFHMPQKLTKRLLSFLPDIFQKSILSFSQYRIVDAEEGPTHGDAIESRLIRKSINVRRGSSNAALRMSSHRGRGARESDEPKRGRGKLPKLPVAGPRVKHVCRSASLVLGQPVATFTNNTTKAGSPPPEVEELVHVEDIFKDKTKSAVDASDLIPISIEEKIKKYPERDGMSQLEQGDIEFPPIARMLQDLGRANNELLDGMENHEFAKLNAKVSIDFWESYDPEEVSRMGFPLIGFNPLKLRALCFLCGSAGLEKMIHCGSCCEPYHPFCVSNKLPVDPPGDWWRLDWFCPKCTQCEACLLTGGTQLSCTKCNKSYHSSCIATARFNIYDNNWVCPACLFCKSCNGSSVHVFVGNMPLCKTCFKLRKRGNFCPLCQCCYDDNDYNTKMMECAECKCWIHAQCEGISNEKYQVLSYLPSSIEFICRLCCKDPPAPWSLAVDAELKAGYLNVIKILSKNKVACQVFKASPKKHRVCVCLDKNRSPIHLNNLLAASESETYGIDSPTGASPFRDYKSSDLGLLTPKLTKDDEESLKTVKSDFLNLVSQKEIPKAIDEHHLDKKDDQMLSLDKSPQLLSIVYDKLLEKPREVCLSNPSDKILSTKEKPCSFPQERVCTCQNTEPTTLQSLSLLSIKNKASSDEYKSVLEFHSDMDRVTSDIGNFELIETYNRCLKQIFPWFDPTLDSTVSESLLADNDATEAKKIIGNAKQSGEQKSKQEECSALKGLLNLDKASYYIGMDQQDTRICLLCKNVGEGNPKREGRLLYCGRNEWVHTNCALWSSEVFEEIDGSLQNVHSAVSRARLIRCTQCGKKGASLGCCAKSCPSAFHFGCAILAECIFLENKEVYCKVHLNLRGDKEMHKEEDFFIKRSVYVELDNKKLKDVLINQVKVYIGSLEVQQLGEIIPDLSDGSEVVIPCNYWCSRLYWSCKEPWKIVRYSIKTKVTNLTDDFNFDNDTNYTVDHSLEFTPPPSPVDSLISDRFSPDPGEKDIKAMISQIIETICVKEEDGGLSDQQGPDLLPPELSDVIFDDLPKDFLDRITVHDIFTKMSFDDPTMPENRCDKNDINDLSMPLEPYSNKINKKSNKSKGRHDKVVKVVDVVKQKGLEKMRDCQVYLDREPVNQWKRKHTILQVDGAMDLSESDQSNDSCDINLKSTEESDPNEDKPVKCARCHRTYRTSQSYDRHLPTCSDFLSCSESDLSEEEKTQGVLEETDQNLHSESQVAVHNSEILFNVPVGLKSITPNLQNVQSFVQNSFENSLVCVNNSNFNGICENGESIVNINYSSLKNEAISATSYPNEQNLVQTPVDNVIPEHMVSLQPTIILQQMPNDNVLPSQFIQSTFQQEAPQPNIQYITAINTQEKTQFLTTNSLGSTTYHIQPQLSQPVVQNVPTVVGTIVQSNGVEQLVLNNSGPSIDVYGHQQNNMYITHTPMIVGMETVVSNTVMQSSRFITGTPGMLSSYSATTTQVFQAAKPVIDIPQSYVVVNTNSPMVENNSSCIQNIIQNSSVPPNSFHNGYKLNYQDASKLNKNSSYQTAPQFLLKKQDCNGMKAMNSYERNDSPVPTYVTLSPVSEKPYSPKPLSIVNNCNSVSKPSNLVKIVELPSSSAVHKEKPQQAVAPVVIKKILDPPKIERPISSQARPKINIEEKREMSCHNAPPKPICSSPLPKSSTPQVLQNEIPEKSSIRRETNDLSNSISNTISIPEVSKKSREQTNSTSLKTNRMETIKKKPVIQEEPKISFEISSEDGFQFNTTSLEEAWNKVYETVQAARKAKNLPPLTQNPFSSPDTMLKKLIGFGNNSMKYLLEQLPGISSCSKYKPVYHKKAPSALEKELYHGKQLNQTGCARTEKFRHARKTYDMFSWLASRHRRPPKLLPPESDGLNGNSRRATSMNLPMAMRFRHLKETSRHSVGVFRSDIHGRGLFCLRDIDAGEMVIEYAGEVIRSALTDKRERYYTEKGIGCYMFRIDDKSVVDATMKGNAARFINHSCEPNCYSRVLDILGKKHILIFAHRKILQGEELTYDYKFPLEEDKINCHCLSRKCRKYLN